MHFKHDRMSSTKKKTKGFAWETCYSESSCIVWMKTKFYRKQNMCEVFLNHIPCKGISLQSYVLVRSLSDRDFEPQLSYVDKIIAVMMQFFLMMQTHLFTAPVIHV